MIVSCPKLLENCNSTLDVSRIQYSKFYKYLILSTIKFCHKSITNNHPKFQYKTKLFLVRHSATHTIRSPFCIIALYLPPFFISARVRQQLTLFFISNDSPSLTTLPSLHLVRLLSRLASSSASFTLQYTIITNSIN